MAKLGSKARPLVLRVQSEERAYFVVASCAEHGWEYVMEIAHDQPEDLGDLEKMVSPALPLRSAKVGRNGPCPCGSGKKYKKCCGSSGATSPSGEPKLSAVIWDYAEPLTELANGPEGTKKAAELAILAWNLAVHPGDGGRAAVEALLRESANGDQEFERNLLITLELMLKRKHTYFNDDSRVIFDYSFTETEDGLALLVRSKHLKFFARLPQDQVPV